MNGPFSVSDYGSYVKDASGDVIARGDSKNCGEREDREAALMICNALNAAYYMSLFGQFVKDEE
jgi:hypothetical protein